MIPKTVIEKQIASLSSTLAPVPQKMQVWAEKNIFIKWGVLSRGKFHCLDCAHAWKPDAQKPSCQKYINCAQCNGKLKNAAMQSGAFQGNRVLRRFGCMRWISGRAHHLLTQEHEKELPADIFPQGSDAALDKR
jgi:hypothetical protein